MHVDVKLFKGLDDLKASLLKIRDILESDSFADTKLAEIEFVIKDALTPLNGDQAMQAAKQRVIRNLQNEI